MIRFRALIADDLPQVLRWRTDPRVSHYLYTDIDPDLPAQQRWFEQIQNDDRCRHWIILIKEQPAGLAYLSDIDYHNKRCSCGYYIGDGQFSRFGGMILPGIANYVFEGLEFNKIYGEVMAGNDNAIALHDVHGYDAVGIWRQHVYKYDSYHDVHLFELLRERWLQMQSHFKTYRFAVED